MKKIVLLTLTSLSIAIVALGAVGWHLYSSLQSSGIDVRIEEPLFTTYRSQRELAYCSPEGHAQTLDLHIPDGRDKYPLIIYVHGGGWSAGSKESSAASAYIHEIARLGYVVAAVNYRLAPQHTFPAQIEDTKCAIRFLRAHAANYHIQQDKVGIIGESAGGYLASLAGTSGNKPTFQTPEHSSVSDQVQAVITLAGPSHFVGTSASAASTRLARVFLGTADPMAASVTTYASPDDPPFLIVHGTADTTVPFEQANILHDSLTAKQVTAKLIQVEGGTHNLAATNTSPSPNELRQTIATFFYTHLKK